MSEFDWIARYFSPLATSKGAAGLLDDVAELSIGSGRLVVTCDALIESVHFLADDPIDTVARKLVRVNVSDILAKGALPAEALLSLGWPAGRPEAELAKFAEALGDDLGKWGATLIGGDTVRAPQGLMVSLTMTGRCGARGPIRRSGAGLGDDVWVTGQIGAGGLGLDAARRGGRSDLARRYRVPEPPGLEIARLIATHATASIDVSDGLLADGRKIASASDVQMALALDDTPFVQAQATLAGALKLATAGDDYQTLFTAKPASRDDLVASTGVSLTRIGRMLEGQGVSATWRGDPIDLPKSLGFVHGA